MDDAFANLSRSGIVSRQNFSCCGTCGVAEIGAEIELEQNKGSLVRGYAFYHMQDTESATTGHGLYLHYGSIEGTAETAVTVGREIVAEIAERGLATEWNGRIEDRIRVELDWKRRTAIEVEI